MLPPVTEAKYKGKKHENENTLNIEQKPEDDCSLESSLQHQVSFSNDNSNSASV